MDMATAVNSLSLQWDPTLFLADLMKHNSGMNPPLSPQQPPLKPPEQMNWYDTFMAQQGQQKPPPEEKKPATPAFGPQQLLALQALMPKQTQWPPAQAVAPRAPNQINLSPVAVN